MKKLFVLFCLLSILSVSCTTTSTGKTGGGDQGFNSEIHGDLYVERNAGFSMYVPKGWGTRDMNQKYLMVIGPTVDNFTANFNFGDEKYSGPLSNYLDAVVVQLKRFYTELDVLESGDFTTLKGIEGKYLTLLGRINEIQARQKLYILPNKGKTAILIITGTAPPDDGERYDLLFDECVKTFNWTK
jgi:hypothetical protein